MKSVNIFQSCIVLLSILFITNCSDPVEDGLESLQGTWSVNQIIETSSIILDLGTEETDQVVNDDPEGLFEFIDQSVDYSYVLTNSEVFGLDDFELTSFKENSGFTKVRRFDLEVGERTFRTVFDDDTNKSYKDATTMTLTETIISESTKTEVVLRLDKL